MPMISLIHFIPSLALLYMPKHHKNQVQMILFVILFAAKLRRCLNRYRKRRDLVQEWIDLEANNIACITRLYKTVKDFMLPSQKAEIVLYGLEAIQIQSIGISKQLEAVFGNKGMQFGKKIIEMCASFEAYEDFLQKHVERQLIMKEIEEKISTKKMTEVSQETDSRITIEQSAQKIMFRTYKLSLLVAKYLKCLHNSHDIPFFRNALCILEDINKKHDHLLRHEQKLKERERIEKILGKKVESTFIYSERCHWHKGEAILHVFENMVIVQFSGQVQAVNLDNKTFDGLHMGCLVTKTTTLHLLFPFGRQLTKFLRVLDNLIHVDDNSQLIGTQSACIFAPFLFAQVVDYREGRDLRGNRREEFIVVFSAISQDGPLEAIQMRSSMRDSGLNWTEVDFSSQPKELNQTVVFSKQELKRIKQICESEYGLQQQLPHFMSFSGQASEELLAMLRWESMLNGILRSKTVINNPILLLKQLQVTDVFLESSHSRTTFSLQGRQRFHCRLCSRLDATSLEQFFRRRLRYLAHKYAGNESDYCYYIFQKLREEVCKIPLSKIGSFRQLIAWRMLRSGHIDYSFRKRINAEKKYFVEIAFLGVDERSFQVEVNQYTLVSEVVDQVCLLASVPVLLGYRLAVFFEDRELLLRPNQIIFPIIDFYNIRYEKSYSASFFSKFKSFGRLLQLSQRGMLVLKQVIFYPLSIEEQIQKKWECQYGTYQFKCEKLIGLSKDSRIQLIVLFAIRQLQVQENKMPHILSHRLYEKYVPNSLEEVVEENKALLQKLYQMYKNSSNSEINGMIESRLMVSPLYRAHVVQMRVCEMSQGLACNKRVKMVLLAIGWKGVAVLTLNERVILSCNWSECSLALGVSGLKVSSERESITLRGLQLYEIYSLCGQCKSLFEQAAMLKYK